MQSNITLIGMPGAGKSVVGNLLASRLQRSFVDTDALIESRRGDSLQALLCKHGFMKLRQFEEEEILLLNVENHVIATGGSAVHSERAMAHLKDISTIVFLDIPLVIVKKRIDDFEQRGIASRKGQTLDQIFAERHPLYLHYADRVISNENLTAESMASLLAGKFRER